jgi:integrating conjugative element membrane protein (TIGR03747 family)
VQGSSSAIPFYEGGYRQAVFGPFRFLSSVGLFVLVTFLTAWLVQTAVVFLWWGGDVGRLEQHFHVEAAALNAAMLNFPILNASAFSDWVYDWAFHKTQIHYVMTTDPGMLTPVDQGIQRFFFSVEPAISTLMLTTKLYSLRLVAMFGAVPVIALGYVIGFTDGLVERALRRYNGGLESSSLYHRAKYMVAGLCGVSAVAFLALPFPIPMMLVYTGIAIATACLARVQWKYYKKYL